MTYEPFVTILRSTTVLSKIFVENYLSLNSKKPNLHNSFLLGTADPLMKLLTKHEFCVNEVLLFQPAERAVVSLQDNEEVA